MKKEMASMRRIAYILTSEAYKALLASKKAAEVEEIRVKEEAKKNRMKKKQEKSDKTHR